MKSFLLSMVMLLAASQFTQLSAQNDSVVAFEVLDISGDITEGSAPLEDVLVELYEGNRVVDSFTTKKNGKFKFTLISNNIYTIQLSKKGYYTKRISVNTRVPADVTTTYKFDFDINLDSREDNAYDSYVVEYPSALVAYDKKKDEFNYDKKYSTSYRDDLEAQQ